MSQVQPFIWKSSLGESVNWVEWNYWGSPKGSQTMLARLIEYQICHQPASSMAFQGEGSERNNGFCSPWCQTLQPLPVCHWCPSSCHPGAGAQREWVWVGKSLCGFFKRNCLELLQFLSLTQSLLVFATRSLGSYLPGAGTLVLWGLVWGWASSPLRYSSRIFICHTWVREQSVLHLRLSYQYGWMWLL